MLLVGDYNSNIYIVSLNQGRNNILLYEQYKNLIDKIRDNNEDLESLNFATEFGGITEIEMGPAGDLMSYHLMILYSIKFIKKKTILCLLNKIFSS